MQTHPVRAPARHPPRRSRLRYRGAVSLQRGPGWTASWRLPREEAAPYLPEGGLGRAAMPSGVRVTLRTDSASLVCRYQADPAPRLNGPEERALVGFVRTVREGRPTTPFAVMSTITAAEREEVPGPSGMTMRECRAHIRRAVTLLRDHGDTRLQYLHGPEVFGPACTRLMLEPEGADRLHPAAAGRPALASRFTTLPHRARCVPILMTAAQ
ncbi:hypothetical protein [Streptomyces sp. 6N106]|uniref:hypothetical protein n=1 Tax=Streptomyces sp. 6N106 TaxID=3457418 RepID=UPI003FD33F15